MLTKKDTFPCKNCNDREVGCHSHCEKFKESKAVYEQKLSDYRQAEKKEVDVNDFKIKSVIRSNKIMKRR